MALRPAGAACDQAARGRFGCGPPAREAALAGHVGEEATARRLLVDPDPQVRASALGALVRMGAATAADAAAGLADPDPIPRRCACELGAALTGAKFADLLDDDDDVVLEAACYAVGEIGDRTAVPALIAIASSHNDALCRESAVAAIGAIGDPRGLPAVVAALEDKVQIRRRAAVALAAFESPEAEAALNRCLTDTDWQVRQVAEDVLEVSDGDG